MLSGYQSYIREKNEVYIYFYMLYKFGRPFILQKYNTVDINIKSTEI